MTDLGGAKPMKKYLAEVLSQIRASPPWCKRRYVPEGEKVVVTEATNLPPDHPIKYWVHPLPGHYPEWIVDADGYGIGAYKEDIKILIRLSGKNKQ